MQTSEHRALPPAAPYPLYPAVATHIDDDAPVPHTSHFGKDRDGERGHHLHQVDGETDTEVVVWVCNLFDSYPVDAVFHGFEDGQQLGILDICALEDDDFICIYPIALNPLSGTY